MMCYNGQGAETGRYFYHRDGLGSVVALSQLSASTVQIVESYAYDIHGRVTIMDSAGADGKWLTPDVTSLAASAVGNPYLFTGRRYDPETRTVGHSGLYYYRARVYHPDLMRFCQPDPIGYADGLNLYAYCLNNGLNVLDPWGLCGDDGVSDTTMLAAAAAGSALPHLVEDLMKNPQDWELVRKIVEPATNRKLRNIPNARSIQEIWRHKRTGQLLRYHSTEPKQLPKHPHWSLLNRLPRTIMLVPGILIDVFLESMGEPNRTFSQEPPWS